MPETLAQPLKLVPAVARFGAALLCQFEQPFVVDSSRFETRYQRGPTPYPEAIARTVAWYRANRARIRTGMMPR